MLSIVADLSPGGLWSPDLLGASVLMPASSIHRSYRVESHHDFTQPARFSEAGWQRHWLASTLPRARRASAARQAAPIIYRGSDRFPRLALTYDDCLLVTRLHMLQAALLEASRRPRDAFSRLDRRSSTTNPRIQASGSGSTSAGMSLDTTGGITPIPGCFRNAELLADYDRWQDALYQVLGSQPLVRFARPPFGNLSGSFLNMCACGARWRPCGPPDLAARSMWA